ncbi:MAG: DUF2269 domain-containing protein [Alphaproteobacteria bacterium]|nr:DUF2269 domain-containing protein [Alphaproteobacteria bacterium]
MWLELIRWAHVLGACVLLGTGAGIAFFMAMANATRDARHITLTARTVILADWLFTATSVIAQPVTGALLAYQTGWRLTEGWILASLGLYGVTGMFWLPVVRIQYRLHALAGRADADGSPLPPAYTRLYRIWFLCGIPAFLAVLTILWLMIARPDL